MDRSAVEKVVAAAAPELSRKLGLSYWSISFGFDALPASDGDPVFGNCYSLVDYNSANIKLNPDKFATAEEVLGTLRHEMFHLILAPVDIYAESVRAIDLPPSSLAVLARVQTYAVEQSVLGLERMYAGLTTKAKRK